MADRPTAYVKKDPGDIIRSGDWNELQIQAREEIRAHTHTGGTDGAAIPRAGIAANAIDGSKIDPAADVNLKSLATTGPLTIGGALQAASAALAGDVGIGGALSVQKDLSIAGAISCGGLTVNSTLRSNGPAALGEVSVSGALTVQRDLNVTNNASIRGLLAVRNWNIGAWPANQAFMFVGVNTLDQSNPGNYALLQEASTGRTFLNSPDQLYLRIKNSDKIVINNDVITMTPSNYVHSPNGFVIQGARNSHLDFDGAFYRHQDGQVYVTVDDLFYIRRSGTGNAASILLDTRNGSVSNVSDIKLKKNIAPLMDALKKVLSLRGVSFAWKSAPDASRQIGLIAQEVEGLFPEMVTAGPDGSKAVNYSAMVAILIEAIKEQQLQIDKLHTALGA
jgi:hypothetical protein